MHPADRRFFDIQDDMSALTDKYGPVAELGGRIRTEAWPEEALAEYRRLVTELDKACEARMHLPWPKPHTRKVTTSAARRRRLRRHSR